ncbi:MAG: ATP-binding cassette domain-containing protein, partial [Candidatus Eremiobacterota bacterium]
AGVSGNGQRELADALAGLVRASGCVRLEGRDLAESTPRERLEAGLSYIPEDRMEVGSILDFSVEENLILRDFDRPPLCRRGLLDLPAIRARAADLIEEYSVRTPSATAPARTLSGGNLQKVVLARELFRQPRVLVAAQPTRGVDLGASQFIHKLLLDQRASGTAILLISEDLDELRALSDRLAVFYGGRLVATCSPDLPLDQLGLWMAGAGR